MLYEYKDWVDIDVEIQGDDDVRLSAPFAQFARPVRVLNCTIVKLDLYASYFLGGLEIENCRIPCDVIWQSGGHNKRPIRIVSTEFGGFLDLEDCLFQAEVTLRHVYFQKGTNLLGNIGTPVEVSFETPPSFHAVEGKLDANTYKPVSGDSKPGN